MKNMFEALDQALASDKGLMHEADLLLQQMAQAEQQGDSPAVLAISAQHLHVWRQLADRGYVPVDTDGGVWSWELQGGEIT